MKVHQIPVGNMKNFTYIVQDESTSKSIVIDPSWDLDKIEQIITRNDLDVLYIVNTHHHFDHTIGNEALAKSLGAKIIQHESSEIYHDVSVSDGDTIQFGDSKLTVHHTPGHSKDSICLVGDGKIFSGDTLFVGNCGRVDLPGGSAAELYDSLFGVLYKLDDSLEMFPGHDYGSTPTSTILQQKRTNFVLQQRSKDEFIQMLG